MCTRSSATGKQLDSALRKKLETAVLRARRAAESASRAVLEVLGVLSAKRPDYLNDDQAALRRALRAKFRQLGGDPELLVAECAYEQWHCLLFAKILAENDLLLHPEHGVPVTLADCEELAVELGDPDGWSIAGQFAAEILPGIFPLDDPCARLRLAPESRHALEQILDDLPDEVFVADDVLGWVYQYWQKDKKDEINASERKIGGADIGPVTQLFTENYMVRFLLENSLGAWWAARHPASPLLASFEYLRFDDDGHPAAGSFDGWPDRVSAVTVMDPCCGSGHFLVEAFSMLWQMRAEEQGLTAVDAQDAVLRGNLFGLEIDPRCVQIAMFAVALQAWKAGGGWRQIPVPNIACSGIAAKSPIEEWVALADSDPCLENSLRCLQHLFCHADTLGSLIDPVAATQAPDSRHASSCDDIEWGTLATLLTPLTRREAADPATSVLGGEASSTARAAGFLARRYTLIATNVPYLGRTGQGDVLRGHLSAYFPASSEDLATAFTGRLLNLTDRNGTVAQVLPESALFLGSQEDFRRALLGESAVGELALLGPGAFAGISGEVVRVALIVLHRNRPMPDQIVHMLDVSRESLGEKPAALCRGAEIGAVYQDTILTDRLARMVPGINPKGAMLSDVANSIEGMSTGDGARYQRNFWELGDVGPEWTVFQRAPEQTAVYGGLDTVVLWENGRGGLASDPGARVQGLQAWGRLGVLVERMSSLRATLYFGGAFQKSTVVVRPADESLLPAIWSYCESGKHKEAVLAFERRIGIATSSIVDVPFDIDRWRRAAAEAGPLPAPFSIDPTQWLFEGQPELSTEPLQVAVARLVGYRWPKQAEADGLNAFADVDGIVCVPSVAGEAPAAERLQQLLAAAFGNAWSPTKVRELLQGAASKKENLADWLRDEFFKQHCELFGNRPFVWHIWDGLRDGFSALVNYHRLDRRTLEKLTYTYLGQDWVERQRAEVRDEVAGSEARLAAALALRGKLEAILEGEKPYDIYVRWKEPHEQPIGWEPDLNVGVRLNIRPFVEACVLRAPFNIHWRKDRGKNPDGSERENDKHLTLGEKHQARRQAGLI